jgi:hypothetical protein
LWAASSAARLHLFLEHLEQRFCAAWMRFKLPGGERRIQKLVNSFVAELT